MFIEHEKTLVNVGVVLAIVKFENEYRLGLELLTADSEEYNIICKTKEERDRLYDKIKAELKAKGELI